MFILIMCRLLLVTCFVMLQVLRKCHTTVTINLHTSVSEGSKIYQIEPTLAASSYTLLHSEFDCPEGTFALTTSGSLTAARDLSTLDVSCVSGSLIASFRCVVVNNTVEQDPQRFCITINVSPNYTTNDFAFVKTSYSGYMVEEQNGTAVSGLSDFYASVSPLGPISSLQYRVTPNTQFAIVTEEILCYKYPKIISIQALDREQNEVYVVTVEAFFDRDTVHSVSTEVRIHLLDVNDNAPTFVDTNSYQILSISELTPLGTQLLQVSAADHDAGTNAAISYTLRNPSNVFVCNHLTGSINILAPLDYESIITYSLTVVARDSGIPSLSSEINITINIVDMNEMAPVIQLPVMPVTLTGDPLTVMVSVSDNDSTSINLTKSGRFSENFEIQQQSSFQFELTLTSLMGLPSHIVDLLLTATDNGDPPLTSTAVLTLQLPASQGQLPSGFLLLEVAEGVPIGSYVGRIELQIDIESYRIVSGNTPGWFTISSDGEVTTVDMIDYETEAQFNLTIEAMLGDEVTSLLTVLIDVMDINDNSPHFSANLTTTSVAESADIIFIFSATDSDDDCNGAVQYYIQYAEPDVFSLDPLSGILSPRYTDALNYEQFQSARVSVRAVDQAPEHPLSTETLLNITITNTNNHAPVITPIDCPCWVMEEVTSQQECPPVTAFDQDVSLDSDNIRFFIQSGNNRSAFGINGVTGVVFTQGRLDHEVQDVYNLGIVASDGVHQSSPVSLTVIITDINDSPPTYASSSLQFSVAENLEVGRMVVSVAATHLDAGYNALTNYSFAAGTSTAVRNTFKLDPASGLLLLQASLSTTASPYTFTVMAVDRLENSQSASATVEISITSPPNQLPFFLLPEEHRVLASNSPMGTNVFQAIAFDPDGDTLSYAIIPAHSSFSINGNSGIVSLMSTLVSGTDYSLVIVAMDSSSPSFSSSMTLQVSVYSSSIRFESVMYSHPASTELCHFNVSLSEEAPSDSTVTVLPSTSQYSLIENEFSDIFYIDGSFLRLRDRAALMRIDQQSVPLNLRALSGNNNHFNICSVIVNIIDVNNNPPIFLRPSTTIEIYRNTPVGSIIYQAVAVDEDTGSLAVPQYSLTGSSNFEIDTVTGFVSIVNPLTNSATSETLMITATDGEQSSLTDQATLIMILLGSNNNDPTFTGSSTSFIVPETQSVGATIVTLTATDSDPGVYGRRSFCIASGDPQRLFSIHNNGSLVIDRMLDREDSTQQASYQLTVIAYDQSPNPVSATRSITISVTEANDEIPTFLSAGYTVSVFEDAVVGTEVVRVTAVDRDPGNGGVVTYSLDNGMGHFMIDSSGGAITTTSSLDREETANYRLTVFATDGGATTRLTGSVTVLIEILDRNDNSPQFDDSIAAQHTLPEDTPVGTSVLQLIAHDDDDGLNGEIVFSVQPIESPFALDPVSGMIIVSRSLDYETAPAAGYRLLARATDRGSPSRSSEVLSLTLTIRDYNEMPPQFGNTSYTFAVPESSATGVTLFTITAIDNDQGGAVEYSLMEHHQVSDSAFEILPSTGAVQLRRSLNRREFPFHQLEITATDMGNPQLTSSVLVHVEITSTLIASPRFLSPYSIQVSENTPVNSSVLWIHAEGYDPSNLGDVLYSIANGDTTNAWGVTATTGVLYLRLPLNYSSLSQYILNMRANRDGASAAGETQVVIQVLPAFIGGLPPSFDAATDFIIHVTEDAMVGATFASLRATGMSPFQYHIDGGTGFGVFMLSDTGELSSRIHPLSLLPSSAYILTITVEDINGLEETEEFVIDVSELNHSPWFSSAVYHSTIRESLSNILLVCVAAEDKDTGANGRVNYTIASGNTRNQFAVNSSTGEVRVLSDPINHESTSEFRMLIRATDEGSLSTTALLIVTVEDLNDRRPQILPNDITSINVFNSFSTGMEVMRLFVLDEDGPTNRQVRYTSSNNTPFFVNASTGAIMRRTSTTHNAGDTFTLDVAAQNVAQPPLSSVANVTLTINVVLPMPQQSLVFNPLFATINIREDIPVGSVVYTVNATGSDLLMYSFADIPSHFTIHPNSGLVYVAASLDREQQSSFSLVIEVHDGMRTAPFILSISIDDVNDNTPQFNQTAYQFTVSESVSTGHMVGIVNAVDLDTDNITFSIVQGRTSVSAGTFDIHSNGQLLTAQLLNREQLAVHELIVEASDGNNFDRAMVIVTVMDENDFTPTFSRSSYNVTVAEDIATGTTILTVTAFDLDHGTNGMISYQLTSTSHFSVNVTTGVVTLISSLDYEESTHHTFNVTATDTVASSTAVVTVLVSDTPDDPPRLCNLTETVTIQENLLAFSPVASVTTCDGERPVKFNITSGNELGHFVIDPSTGVVFSAIVLDREWVEQYALMITAVHTSGGPSRDVPLTVIIEDENDNLPQLNPPAVIVDVPEDSQMLSTLYTFNITDRDSESNGVISIIRIYDFPASQYFMINPAGELTLSRTNLDRENLFRSIRFQIYIYDSGTPPQAAAYSVTINVVDSNEAPNFHRSTYITNLATPVLIGARVLYVIAEDHDDNEFGSLQYSISGGNSSEHFSIDAQSGSVTVRDNFLMQPAVYHLMLTITDGGGLQDTCDVFVLTQECPDSTLLFQPNVYTTEVFENASQNTILFTPVLLNYGRRDSNGIDFSLPVEDGVFRVTSTSGDLTLNKSLDREVQPSYQLVLQAVDEATSRLAVTYITVVVLDINDNTPVFQGTPYVAFVEDTTAAGSFVARVSATDQDDGRNAEIEYSLPSESLGLFAINATTGEIHTVRTLDGVMASPVELAVQAQDGGQVPLSSETTVSVHVMDSRAPLFSSPTYTANVSEDATVGTLVTTVSAMSRSDTTGGITYTIEDGDDLSQFTIGGVSGEVSVHMFLDYETVPEYRLELRALDMGASLSTITFLIIQVTDANDNRPVFTQGIYTASVLENATLGTMLTQVAAVDIDTGMNKKINLQLPTNSYPGVFRIDSLTGWVSLSGALDRELACSNLLHEQPCIYNFPVEAVDGGIPPLTGTAQVRVAVGNINDNNPEFTEDVYMFSVEEDAEGGNIVGFIVAIDADGDSVRYSLTAGDDSRFILNTDSGQLTLNSSFTDGDPVEYTLNVMACDPFMLCGSAMVNVGVIDINNHFPIFTEAVYEADVSENIGVGDTIFTVLATDNDRGTNAAILYRIQDSFAPFFMINNITGEIAAVVSLDRETRSLYELLVFAVDGGGLSGAATVRLIVTDVNDNIPRFSLPLYSISIPEGLSVGTVFLRVNAEDSDSGENGTLIYTFIFPVETEPTTFPFSINSSTGEISVRLTLIEPVVVNFSVAVRDQGISPMSGEPASVSVAILDTNRSPPVFSEPFYNASVLEEQPSNTFVLNVIATAINDITFRLVTGSDNFRIVQNNGTIVTEDKLDREMEGEYTLRVSAHITYVEAGGEPQLLTSFVEVYIRVTDVNENPEFVEGMHIFSVRENAPIMTPVTTGGDSIAGIDGDLGDNGVFRFQLLSNNVPFYINAITGEILVNGTLDYEATTVYTLRIGLQDLGIPPLTSMDSVSVYVVDENDSPPVFTNATYHIELLENVTLEDPVLTVMATDADTTPSNAMIFYSLSEVSPFNIDSSTGIISLMSSSLPGQSLLDRETTEHYELTIVAYDALDIRDAVHTANATLLVTVLDVDDEAPVFNVSQFEVTIMENYPANQVFVQLTAKDPDIGGDALIRYGLVQGLHSDNFTINETTGQISFTTPPDYEAIDNSFNTIEVTVQASDPGGREGLTTLRVNILDENDNYPRFSNSSYTGTVVENSLVFTSAVHVVATDADSSLNGQIFYTLFGDHNFAVVRDTGMIYLTASLDREQQSSYNLTVEARDMGTPMSLATNITVYITVTDVNDNAPEFSQEMFQVEVSEAMSVDSVVVQITALDIDEGVNANLTYEIISGDDLQHFRVERHTGKLLVAMTLNYEQTRSYNITLQASDGDGNPLMDTTLVHVIVTDANDNTPSFLQPQYSKSIEENITVPFLIITTTATDLDSGTNAVIEYSIFEASRSPEIDINSTTGEIYIISSLNYEIRREFQLTVLATDMGIEQNTGIAQVLITVIDVNDNPPQFMPPNVTATVRENSVPNSNPVVRLRTEDADSVNGMIRYYIVSGNEGNQFMLNNGTGELRSNVVFDREELASYILVVTAEDNGSPSLTGTSYVTIIIIDDDDSRPSDAETNVFIYHYQNNAFPQVLGRVYIEDNDVNNSYTYRVVAGPSDVFTISNGRIFYPNTRPAAGEYTFTVEVEDGSNGAAISTVRIVVTDVSEDMLREAVFLQLVNVNEVTFAHENYIRFRQVVAPRLEVDAGMVHLFGLQPSVNRTGLDVQLAVQVSSGDFLQRRTVEHLLHKFRTDIMLEAGVEIFTERADLCASEPCGDRGECSNAVEFSDMNLLVRGASVILQGVHRTHQYQCDCLPGYSGDTCEDGMFDYCYSSPCPEFANCTNTVDGHECICPAGTILDGDDCLPVDCESLNCVNGGSCDVTSTGLKCTCPSSFVGDSCEIPLDITDVCADEKPCQQGNCTFSHAGFTCTCPVNFTGSDCGRTTTTNIGSCFQNPCQHGATCTPVGNDISFNCMCPSGYTGEHCETFLYAMETEDKEATDEPISCQENSCSANERCIVRDNMLLCATDDCTSSPCLNGGTCFPQYPGFYCFCRDSFDGPRCERTQASFAGTSSSYTVFASSLQQQLTSDIHLEFVTASANGLLLFTGRFDDQYHDVMILQLVNSMLQLTVSYGGTMTILSSAVVLDDSLWHEIDIQYNSTVSS